MTYAHTLALRPRTDNRADLSLTRYRNPYPQLEARLSSRDGFGFDQLRSHDAFNRRRHIRHVGRYRRSRPHSLTGPCAHSAFLLLTVTYGTGRVCRDGDGLDSAKVYACCVRALPSHF